METGYQIQIPSQAHIAPPHPPAVVLSGTVKIRIDDDQAGDAAPAEADLEKRQPIREGDYLGGVESFIENDRKNAGCPGEVAPQIFVPRAGWQGRMQHGLDVRVLPQPLGDFEGRFLEPLQPYAQSLQAAER